MNARVTKMEPPDPEPDESREDYINRCMDELASDDPEADETEIEEVCDANWDAYQDPGFGGESAKPAVMRTRRKVRRKDNKDIFDELDFPEPDVGENREDYVDRCIDEVSTSEASDDYDESELEAGCQATAEAFDWDENDERVEDSHKPAVSKRPKWKQPAGITTFKTHAGKVSGTEFILSDETPDRMGDIINADGWQLDNFNKNPIALFNHKADFPIGRWENLHVDAEIKALRGHLILAPAGISERIDEIRKLIEAGILKAVSVGFKPLKSEQLDKDDPWSGKRFREQELVETSLVSVPANPNALAVAKSLHISDSTLSLVFDKPVRKQRADGLVRRPKRQPAAIHSIHKVAQMNPLGSRIADAEKRISKLRDGLTDHLKNVDDSNVSDTQLEITNGFNSKIAQEEKSLVTLREAERHLAVTSEPPADKAALITREGTAPQQRRPFAVPAHKVQPQDYVWRSLVCQLKAHVQKKSFAEVLKETYGDDEPTRIVASVVTKAAALPADTVTSGWASQLVETSIQEFMGALLPVSIFPQLAAKGGSFTFGRAGIISMPTRAPTPTIAGSFVAQGAPIPVRQAAFTAVTLTPKKMGVISTFTREISEHSTPAIEGLIRQAIVEDTAVAIDTVLLDANPATTIRPAGLRNGVAAITATAGGGLAGIIGDLRSLTAAMITSTNGNLRSPVWIMNPGDILAVALTPAVAGGGEFPFKAELAAGTLLGYPIIASTNMAADMMMLIDAADFISVTGTEPRFDVSDQATLHMEDTAPLQLATGAQGSGVVATPARSLWQTDTIGIRMLLDMNWALRRTGTIAWTQTMTWN
jgi:HK97 family phage major capsid protein/HK97 family phage prohead protease